MLRKFTLLLVLVCSLSVSSFPRTASAQESGTVIITSFDEMSKVSRPVMLGTSLKYKLAKCPADANAPCSVVVSAGTDNQDVRPLSTFGTPTCTKIVGSC